MATAQLFVTSIFVCFAFYILLGVLKMFALQLAKCTLQNADCFTLSAILARTFWRNMDEMMDASFGDLVAWASSKLLNRCIAVAENLFTRFWSVCIAKTSTKPFTSDDILQVSLIHLGLTVFMSNYFLLPIMKCFLCGDVSSWQANRIE